MELSFFDKVQTLVSYMFSSFLSIELLLFSVLLFVLLIFNLKRKEKIIIYALIAIYVGLLLGTMIAYHEYVLMCIREFFKVIISYICFPTTVAFFSTTVFITAIMIYTFFSKKITNFKKIFNYLVFSIMYFFFMSIISLAAYHNIDIGSNVSLYTNNYVLVLVQASNLLLLLWFIFTFFYRLYSILKEKFD